MSRPPAACVWGWDGDGGEIIYRYRYDLALPRGGTAGRCVFLMLNPSTADEARPDPTVSRCIGFAERLGHATLTVVNLFALRATDPADMLRHPDPIGPDNDTHIGLACADAARVICAWGNHGKHLGRARAVVAGLAAIGVRLSCLGTNRDGSPKHPLYLKSDSQPRPWSL